MIYETMNLSRGVISVIGAGGKTSLIRRLALELGDKEQVIICTTTHILRPTDIPVIEETPETALNTGKLLSGLFSASDLSSSSGVVCIGTAAPDDPDKLTAPVTPIDELAGMAAFCLVEADGSRHLPMKAHALHEPVIPAGTKVTILTVGAEGFGRPIKDAVHRPELFASLADASINEPVTPRILSRVLTAEKDKYGSAPVKLVINRTLPKQDHLENDLKNDLLLATELKELTGFETYAGAVTPGILQKL